MKLRTFLSTLCLSPAIGLIAKSDEVKHTTEHKPTAPSNVTLKELPKPIDKLLEFDYNGFHVTASITKNFLIDCRDDEGNLLWETNQYQRWNKCIANAYKHPTNPLLYRNARFESEMFLDENVDYNWKSFIDKIKIQLDNVNLQLFTCSEFPKKIKV